MNSTKKRDINAELEFIEKLHRLGDDISVRHLARGLLLSETLTPLEKKRIQRVLNSETRTGKIVTFFVVLIFVVLFFLYVKYYA